jgi:site-specific DNA-cytosine methylase
MRFLSLFAGIGGFDLGLERAGMECVGQVENDPYCIKVLEKHWPDVPRWGDIRDVTEETLADACGERYGENSRGLQSRRGEERAKREGNVSVPTNCGERGNLSGRNGTDRKGIKEPANADGIDLICGGFP